MPRQCLRKTDRSVLAERDLEQDFQFHNLFHRLRVSNQPLAQTQVPKGLIRGLSQCFLYAARRDSFRGNPEKMSLADPGKGASSLQPLSFLTPNNAALPECALPSAPS